MAWQFVSKSEAAQFCGVNETLIKDVWSDTAESLIKAYYKFDIGEASYEETYDGEGKSIIFLRHTPINSVASIQYLNYTPTEPVYFTASSTEYIHTTNYIQLLNGNVFPTGVRNIRINYTAGIDINELDPRLKFAELMCIATMVKYVIANRGEDSLKFSSAAPLGTNQYTQRPGVLPKFMEIIRDAVPHKVRMR